MNVYIENIKESAKNILEIICNFNKIAVYRVSIQKLVVPRNIYNYYVTIIIKNKEKFEISCIYMY